MQAGEGGGGVIGVEATVLRRFMEAEGDDDDDDMFLGMDTMEPSDGLLSMSTGEPFCFVFVELCVYFSCILLCSLL